VQIEANHHVESADAAMQRCVVQRTDQALRFTLREAGEAP